MCQEEKLLGRLNKVVKQLFNYFWKKIQKQPPEVKKQSPEELCKKGVLKYFANFTEKNLCWSLLNKVTSLQPANKFYKKRPQLKCFPVKFTKLLRAYILKKICKRLFLKVFYNKAVLKNFAIFTGRKWVVISLLWKNLSIC